MKDYIKTNWRFLLFVLCSGLIGGCYFCIVICSRASSRHNGHDNINSAIVVQMFFVQRRTGAVFWLPVSEIRNWLCNDSSWICAFDFGFADDLFL